jgi:hypothetical protein
MMVICYADKVRGYSKRWYSTIYQERNKEKRKEKTATIMGGNFV